MKLKQHCKIVEERLSKDLVRDSDLGNEERVIKLIRGRIGKHHIPMNVLRAYAAIYLFQNAGHKGMSIEQLNATLTEDDVVTDYDVIVAITRLHSSNIIKFDGKLYSLVAPS